jgi:hypothetical protein
MDDLNYTIAGLRPDLAAIEVNEPEGYISEKLMPTLKVYQPAGILDYHAKVADTGAQRDREVGASPTSQQIAQSSLEFSCEEVIKRGAIAPKQVPIMGGIENADKIGAKFAKRQVMAAREADVAALVLHAPNANFSAGDVVTQAATARKACKGIFGKLLLVAGQETLAQLFMELVTENGSSELFSRIVSGTSPNVAMEGLDPAAQARAIATLFGCQGALAGDDEIWGKGNLAGRFAIGRFDDGEEDAHLAKPVFGRVLQYLPDGKTPISITSIPFPEKKNNYYDAEAHMVAKVLNSSGVYVFGGVGG